MQKKSPSAARGTLGARLAPSSLHHTFPTVLTTSPDLPPPYKLLSITKHGSADKCRYTALTPARVLRVAGYFRCTPVSGEKESWLNRGLQNYFGTSETIADIDEALEVIASDITGLISTALDVDADELANFNGYKDAAVSSRCTVVENGLLVLNVDDGDFRMEIGTVFGIDVPEAYGHIVANGFRNILAARMTT